MTEYKRVYLDTAPLIYYLENSSLYMARIKKFFEQCLANNVTLVTSTITVEEYLVFPYANNRLDLARNFWRFINYMNMEIVDIDRVIAEQAARIRGEYPGFKAMDSLQIAAAIISGCEVFVTNDKQLRQTRQIACLTLADL